MVPIPLYYQGGVLASLAPQLPVVLVVYHHGDAPSLKVLPWQDCHADAETVGLVLVTKMDSHVSTYVAVVVVDVLWESRMDASQTLDCLQLLRKDVHKNRWLQMSCGNCLCMPPMSLVKSWSWNWCLTSLRVVIWKVLSCDWVCELLQMVTVYLCRIMIDIHWYELDFCFWITLFYLEAELLTPPCINSNIVSTGALLGVIQDPT